MIHLALGAPYETKPYGGFLKWGYLWVPPNHPIKPCLVCIEIQFFWGSPILRNHHILALISSDFGDTFSLFEEAQMDWSMMPARYYAEAVNTVNANYRWLRPPQHNIPQLMSALLLATTADPAHISVIPSSIFCWGLLENGGSHNSKGLSWRHSQYPHLHFTPPSPWQKDFSRAKMIKMGLLSSHCFSCHFLSPQRSAGISTQFERLTGWPKDAAFFLYWNNMLTAKELPQNWIWRNPARLHIHTIMPHVTFSPDHNNVTHVLCH